MEIYTLIIRFPYDEDDESWIRTIEVREDFSLQHLHNYIQELVDFDNDHLYEFYIGKNPNNRITALPKRTKLNEIYPMTGAKLYYLFDFGDNWLFEIKKSRKKTNITPGVNYPRLIEAHGENPEQYDMWEE